jgi:predicted nucleic acid-binding Zn ribbon protein
MPVYVYRIIRPVKKRGGSNAAAEETFEVQQSMQDSPLTHHPDTGEPVQRVLTVPHVATPRLGDSEIANSGLTKYKRMSDGTYERQAGGGGPKHVNPRGGS